MKKQTVGEMLKEARLEKGLSIKSVSKEVGLDFTYISKIENNHRTPLFEHIKKFSKLYEIDPEECLAVTGELPEDLQNIIKEHGVEVFDYLRKGYK